MKQTLERKINKEFAAEMRSYNGVLGAEHLELVERTKKRMKRLAAREIKKARILGAAVGATVSLSLGSILAVNVPLNIFRHEDRSYMPSVAKVDLVLKRVTDGSYLFMRTENNQAYFFEEQPERGFKVGQYLIVSTAVPGEAESLVQYHPELYPELDRFLQKWNYEARYQVSK